MLASFTAGMEYQRGDVNQDGNVSISDVTCLIDYLLSGTWGDDPVIPQTETFTVNGVSFTMVNVDGGTFMMGTADDDEEAWDNEKPAHEVTLSSYSIGQTEVTQALWLAVMGNNPSQFSSANGYTENLTRPVEEVTWHQCKTFITKLNQLTGKSFRLPTEAEWEFAARGGNYSHGYKYAGSDSLDYVAWYRANIPGETTNADDYGTQPVATKAPNELNLYDMTGNVMEWCQDWYADYTSEAQTNPVGPESGPEGASYRVCRGACWLSYSPRQCRLAFRNSFSPAYNCSYLGLRLAL